MAVAQKLCCKVQRIVDHGEHVYTVDLVSDKLFPVFKPGQFLHLALDTYDPAGFWPDSRIFSIASPSLQRERLSITYSVRGRFTVRMEKELAEGKMVWVKMPYGEFVIQAKGDVVLLAGGTGITAFISFLSGLTQKTAHKIYITYGVRNAKLLIYRDIIEYCARNNNHIQPCYYVEEEPIDSSSKGSGILGRISINEMWKRIDDPYESIFYLSGPPEMTHMLSSELKKRGVGIEAIRIDAWE